MYILCGLSWAYKKPLLVVIDKNGGVNILGRSDGVLNPQGVRFGTAELYTVLEEMKDECVAFPEPIFARALKRVDRIEDSIAVGQRAPDGDDRVLVSVLLRMVAVMLTKTKIAASSSSRQSVRNR